MLKTLNIANLISLGRLFAVPFIVALILEARYEVAFYMIFIVGILDALDGFLARWLKCQTTLGRYLDPLADKALLVSLYVTLSVQGFMPVWLTIAVVSRDAVILIGVLLLHVMGHSPKIKPILLSKLNTFLQLVTILWIMITYLMGLWWTPLSQGMFDVLCYSTLFTTLSSGLIYTFIALNNPSITHKEVL